MRERWRGQRTATIASAKPLRILSLTLGRLRVHLAAGHGEPAERIEAAVRKRPGVESVEANPLTGNVLVRFDPRRITSDVLLAALDRLEKRLAQRRRKADAQAFRAKALRAGVRGVVGHAVVDTLLYTVAFAEPFGLPLAALAKLHLTLDVFIWGAALAPLLEKEKEPSGRDGLAAPPATA
jgi:copper chaperone CopZ